MKNISKQIILLAMVSIIFNACKKQEVSSYEDDPAIYFTLPSYSYSFIEDVGAQTKTIYLPVSLSGNVKDFDRNFKVEVVNDTNTNVTSDLYEIKQGELLKGSFTGRVPIVLKRNQAVEESLVKLKVKLIGSSELDPIMSQTVQITWTGKIIQPVNWSSLRFYFGTPFSVSWYLFMLKEAGVSSLPYYTTLSKTDPVTWWMSAGQVQAYALKVKEALNKYNVANPGNELRHQDGAFKGQLVTMP